MASPYPVRLGVIGGSGLYQMEGTEVAARHTLQTPFGAPSDDVIEVHLHHRPVFFIPRHGVGHRLTPSEVNYRANIYALKSLGVTHVLGVNACGIMREGIRPGDLVVPDQIYDRTKGIRPSTFFGDGIVGHVSFADPFSHEMRASLLEAVQAETTRVHDGGTYVCIEGPQFSTRAESRHYCQTLAPTVIGMTAVPEAKLAREAELAYACLALATDYDCWHETEDDVSVSAVIAVLNANASLATKIIKGLAQRLPQTSTDECLDAARYAIMTAPKAIPEQRKKDLDLLYGRYFR